ncbi:TetR/AcrR family transcriptional regulator [Caulobacter sp. KR2-114]|uniref:TetR/AcrR family transcriptional regulator n=1 Tax=Caulobacter sp. KR2-114 TaxID=3400912 RepID=UPI003C0A5C46
MRITSEQASENHRRVVEAASRLFREHGFDGVSVADIMKAAGFTHGGFYNHFRSKEALAVEALEHAFAEMAAQRERAATLQAMTDDYLSDLHRRARGRGCPAAALAGDAPRQPDPVRSALARGTEEMINAFASRLSPALGDAERRTQAVDLLCRLTGALTLARATPDGDPLSEELLAAARAACAAMI